MLDDVAEPRSAPPRVAPMVPVAEAKLAAAAPITDPSPISEERVVVGAAAGVMGDPGTAPSPTPAVLLPAAAWLVGRWAVLVGEAGSSRPAAMGGAALAAGREATASGDPGPAAGLPKADPASVMARGDSNASPAPEPATTQAPAALPVAAAAVGETAAVGAQPMEGTDTDRPAVGAAAAGAGAGAGGSRPAVFSPAVSSSSSPPAPGPPARPDSHSADASEAFLDARSVRPLAANSGSEAIPSLDPFPSRPSRKLWGYSVRCSCV